MKIKAFLALLLSFCILLPALAQTQPSAPPPPPKQRASDDKDEVVKITTNLVQVDAIVTKDGKPVTNLTADDFEIYEDGKKQTITSFAYISNVPAAPVQPAIPSREKRVIIPPSAPVNRDQPHRTVAFVVDDLGISAESMGARCANSYASLSQSNYNQMTSWRLFVPVEKWARFSSSQTTSVF